MYQPPRPSTRPNASAGSSPRPNPLRSNNDREEPSDRRGASQEPSAGRMVDSGSDMSGSLSTDDRRVEQAKEAHKLNQIVQQFFVKGALTIASSRATLPQAFNKSGVVRQNKWFNLLLDDSDELLNQIVDWRTLKLDDGDRPPLLVFEVYLDLDELTSNQSLVIIDDEDRRWAVAEELAKVVPAGFRPSSRSGRLAQVVIERWEITLGGPPSSSDSEPLHNVYKKAVPLFRSLYTLTRQLPAWKLHRRIARQPMNHPALKLNYRILNGQFKNPRQDTLSVPLYPSQGNVAETISLSPLQCPAGSLRIAVTYRESCDFRVDDSESLLSNHFMGMDDRYFRPTLAVPSSVPTHRNLMHDEQDRGQVYGSLSTFHNKGPAPSTSPISALRAVRDYGSASPDNMAHRLRTDNQTALDSRASLRQADPSAVAARRASVSFQPFKAGSLASSPAPGLQVPPSPSGSLGRQSSLASRPQVRHRYSLSSQTLPQAAQRIPVPVNDTAIASSASSSPRPAPINRYSSSFSHRRSRFSTGGTSTSKGEDDNTSSGKQSASSSTRREAGGSDVINDGQGGGSSGSMPTAPTDDDNLKDFIRLLEQKKDLKSFSKTDSASRDASMRRTTAALSKYQRMRDSNTALSDSLSSSLLLQRSSSSSSRQLSAVPQMIPGSSISTSSSPGKPISPHTPHTPAIPSRLAANEILTYDEMPRRSRSRVISRGEASLTEADVDPMSRERGAIDIPTSPSAWPYQRRSSSAAQQHRSFADEEPELFGLRGSSLPGVGDDRTDLSISELLRVTPTNDPPAPMGESAVDRNDLGERTGAAFSSLRHVTLAHEDDSASLPSDAYVTALQYHPSRLSDRRGSSRTSSSFGRGVGSLTVPGYASAQAPQGSEDGSARGSIGSRYRFGSRQSQSQSQTQQQDDDEPAIFTMSDIAQAGRRSVDEGRGGSPLGRSSKWSR